MPDSVPDPGAASGGRWVMAGSGAAVALSVVGVLVFAPGESPTDQTGRPMAAHPAATSSGTNVRPAPEAPEMPNPGSARDGGSGVLNGLIADGKSDTSGPAEPEADPVPQEVSIRKIAQGGAGKPAAPKAQPVVHVDVQPARVAAPAPRQAAPAKVAAPQTTAPKVATAKTVAPKTAAAPQAPAYPDPAFYGYPGYNPYGPTPYGAYPNPYGAYPYGGGPMYAAYPCPY
ncbi:hypothetical protein [Amycolatopsis sp. NPDC059657]|uniref:hypothetical protein n=1 Tax=Amycolatopsis sp. NPDC059657 TaxID=3346899 RepID=UPI003672D96C